MKKPYRIALLTVALIAAILLLGLTRNIGAGQTRDSVEHEHSGRRSGQGLPTEENQQIHWSLIRPEYGEHD